MSRKDKLLLELEHAAASMVQGSLSESTRQCGDPSCACAHDPASRHGPHLYFRYRAEGQVRSVYVPAELGEALGGAQSAGEQSEQICAGSSEGKRARLLSTPTRKQQI